MSRRWKREILPKDLQARRARSNGSGPGIGGRSGCPRWKGPISITLVVLAALTVFLVVRGRLHHVKSAPNCAGVSVSPLAGLQALVDAQPPGTHFCLGPGTYRSLSVVPKSGDVISGAGQARTILDGANVIATFGRSGSLWYADKQFQHSPPVGQCATLTPLCFNAETVYFDNRPLRRVPSTSAVKLGTFYFDYEAHRAYFADNPAGHRVEVGATEKAIVAGHPRDARPGGSVGVTVEYLTVEKYADSAQHAPVETGDGWLVKDVTSRLNGGAGIMLFGYAARADHCQFVDNGEEGIGSDGGDGQDGYHHAVDPLYVSNSEIAGNNVNGYDPNWEGGGAKFWQTKNSVIAHNFVHDNVGAGLWDDGWNDNITYDSNRIIRSSAGISHEIGSSAVIKNNVLIKTGNANLPPQACQGAICIASSDGAQSDTTNQTIDIEHNYLSHDGFGIILAKTHPDVVVDHVYVRDNVVRESHQAVAWVVDNQNAKTFRFDDNHYSKEETFGFSQAVGNWPAWRRSGADRHGDLKADSRGAPRTAGIVSAS